MQINLESTDKHSIQAYSETELHIDSQSYQANLVVSSQEIIQDWPIKALKDLDEKLLQPLLKHKPEIIIIGHNQQGQFPPFSVRQSLSRQRIGLESMSIGAACRTFNVLLSEGRYVVLGIIF